MAKFIELHKGKETYLVNLDTVSMVTGNTRESESWWYYTDCGEYEYSMRFYGKSCGKTRQYGQKNRNAERKCKMEHEKCATCKPLTNGDKIRAMSDNELAVYLCNVRYCPTPSPCDPTKNYNDCWDCWNEWLRSPVEESEK